MRERPRGFPFGVLVDVEPDDVPERVEPEPPSVREEARIVGRVFDAWAQSQGLPLPPLVLSRRSLAATRVEFAHRRLHRLRNRHRARERAAAVALDALIETDAELDEWTRITTLLLVDTINAAQDDVDEAARAYARNALAIALESDEEGGAF